MGLFGASLSKPQIHEKAEVIYIYVILHGNDPVHTTMPHVKNVTGTDCQYCTLS